jgi:hypothetical protein
MLKFKISLTYTFVKYVILNQPVESARTAQIIKYINFTIMFNVCFYVFIKTIFPQH